MRAAPVLTAARAGTARRLVQSLVVFIVLAVSSAAAVTGLTLAAAANQAYALTVRAEHVADLTVTIDASKVTASRLAATRHLPGVTRAAGPYPQATITIAAGAAAAGKRPGGQAPETVTVVGRASPSGPLNNINASPSIMASYGNQRWPDRLGEIALADDLQFRLPVGSKVTAISAPGRPVLIVTGYGETVVNQANAWVLPGEVARLRAAGAQDTEQMLYSFASAGTAAQVRADLAEVTAALPSGAVVSSWSLLAQVPPGGPANANTPFLVAFALLGLVLAVLITASVVSAAVIASYRRIGVLKSIGFTPVQVTATYLAQIAIPAVAGAVAGTLLGNRWVLPVINPFPGRVKVFIPLWINLTAPLGLLTLAGLVAAVPAVRAARLRAAGALTAGQAPRAGRGAVAYRLAGRLGLPAPVTAGLAAPFSRPARSAVMLAALVFGLTGVVLGTSLDSSIREINDSASHAGQLEVSIGGGRTNTFTPSQEAVTRSAIGVQPGTLRYVAEADLLYPGAQGHKGFFAAFTGMPPPQVSVSIAGLPSVAVWSHAYDGASWWLGWSLVSGRWYDGPGQIDVSTAFAAWAGVKAGDNVTLKVNGKPVTVRVAGVVFVPDQLPTLWVSWQTLGMPPALTASQYDIGLTPGTSVRAYAGTLRRTLGPGIMVSPSEAQGIVTFAPLDLPLFTWLTILVAMLAGLGVLSAALMATRERVHDLGVFKAAGMTPWQAIVMVICWVIAPAIIAAAIALPAGLIIQDILVRRLAPRHFALPGSFVHVLSGTDLLLLALAGLAIAIAGALGPAGWAARTRTSAVLRTE